MVLKDRINENDHYNITDKSIIQIIGGGDKESNDGDADDVKEDGVPHAKGFLETSWHFKAKRRKRLPKWCLLHKR